MLKSYQIHALYAAKCQEFANFFLVYKFPGNNYTRTIRIFNHPGSNSTHKPRHTRN